MGTGQVDTDIKPVFKITLVSDSILWSKCTIYFFSIHLKSVRNNIRMCDQLRRLTCTDMSAVLEFWPAGRLHMLQNTR